MTSTSCAAPWPAFIDEIVGYKRIQQFQERCCAGSRKIGIHGTQTTLGNLTRQPFWPAMRILAYHICLESVTETFVTPSVRL